MLSPSMGGGSYLVPHGRVVEFLLPLGCSSLVSYICRLDSWIHYYVDILLELISMYWKGNIAS